MMFSTRGGVMIEFSEMRGPNKIFGSFYEPNNIIKPPLVFDFFAPDLNSYI